MEEVLKEFNFKNDFQKENVQQIILQERKRIINICMNQYFELFDVNINKFEENVNECKSCLYKGILFRLYANIYRCSLSEQSWEDIFERYNADLYKIIKESEFFSELHKKLK